MSSLYDSYDSSLDASTSRAQETLADSATLRTNPSSACPHFTVEKESTSIKALLKDTATASVNGRASPDQVLQNLDAMIAKMRGVKRKLTTYADEEARLYHQTEARIAHLGELYGMHSFDDVKYETWSRKRLDRLLVDYLLRQGYNDSAHALTAEKNMEDLVDVQTFVSMSRIQESLRGGSVAEALAWCQDNKKELRKKDSSLEFMLRFQQYVELLRSHKYLEAIAHLKKYIVPYKSVYPDQCRKAFGLLAYSDADAAANTTYAALYSLDRWTNLVDIFTNNHNELLALPRLPLLHIALSSGLSALKTPACHSSSAVASFTTTIPFSPEQYPETNAGIPLSSSNEAQRWRQSQQQQDHDMQPEPSGDGARSQNPHPHHHHHQQARPAAISSPAASCPICSTELNDLARNVPYAHHTKSHVDTDLLLLPNGNAFGKDRLEDYARKSGLEPEVEVKDLKTGATYHAEELKKVYIT
ncbi:Protein FYV10 [Verticillium dahliae]